MSGEQRKADLAAATACICTTVDGATQWQETRDNIVDEIEAARSTAEAALAKRVREAGEAALGECGFCVAFARDHVALDVGEDSPSLSGIYARALLAMLEALPKEPTDAET